MSIPQFSQSTVNANNISHVLIAYDYYEGEDPLSSQYGWKAYISPGDPSGGGFPLSTEESDVFGTRSEAVEALRQSGWDALPVYTFTPGRIGTHSGSDVLIEYKNNGTDLNSDTLFENHSFTVTKMNDGEILIDFLGLDNDEVVAGWKRFIGGAASQLERLLLNANNDDRRMEILHKRTGIDLLLKPASDGDRYYQDYETTTQNFVVEGNTINMSLVNAPCGEEEWWVEVLDENGRPSDSCPEGKAFMTADEARFEAYDIYDSIVENKMRDTYRP